MDPAEGDTQSSTEDQANPPPSEPPEKRAIVTRPGDFDAASLAKYINDINSTDSTQSTDDLNELHDTPGKKKGMAEAALGFSMCTTSNSGVASR